MRTIILALRTIILALYTILFAATNSVAAGVNDRCQSPYMIYFSNGVLNSIDDMDDALFRVREEMGVKYNDVPINYGSLRNETGGIIDDLIRVYRQKLSENPTLKLEIIVRAIIGFSTGIDPSLFASAQQLVVDVNTSSGGRIGADIKSTTAYADANSITQTQQVVHSVVKDGRRVLIIAHSQGNLYSNAVYRAAIGTKGVKPNNIKVVGIATPAGTVQGAGDYLTSDSDAIIGALRMLAGNVLPSNFSVPFNPNDISGHLFLKTYMNPSLPSMAAIKGLIAKNLQQIDEPDDAFDWLIKGRISVSGGWVGSETDATFIPSPRCDGVYADIQYCVPGRSNDYLQNANRTFFDPRVQLYSVESSKALDRLRPFSNALSDPDNGLNRLIMGTIPIISDSMDTTIINNNTPVYTWSSIWYDRQMNFPSMEPDPLTTPAPPKTADYPRSHTVYHAKIQDSIASTVQSLPPGKAFLEIYDILSAEKAVGGIRFISTDRLIRLKICKIQPKPALSS